MKKTNQGLRKYYAASAFNFLPEFIKDNLVLDHSFLSTLGLVSDATLVFGQNEFTIDRSIFFTSIRQLFEDKRRTLTILDNNEESLKIRHRKGGAVEIVKGKQRYLLSGFIYLSPKRKERVDYLLSQAALCNLPQRTVSKWKSILFKRPITDDEFNAIEADISNTPVEFSKKVQKDISAGSSQIKTLAVNSSEYYLGLIGLSNDSTSFQDYLDNDLNIHIEKLVKWKRVEGLYWAFLLCAHYSISSSLIKYVRRLDEGAVAELYRLIVSEGDIITKIGAIEVGLSILNEFPSIEPQLVAMLMEILDKESTEVKRTFELLSSLVVLVDGENARTKVLSEISPSLRRLAAFSQASLLSRLIIPENINVEQFSSWAFNVRCWDYYLRNLIDLREEPRWLPDSIYSDRLRADCIGRIHNAACLAGQENLPEAVQALLIGDIDKSLRNQLEFPFSFMPGPLEGKADVGPEPPQDIIDTINGQLTSEEIDIKSFIALINSCLLYPLDVGLSEKAAKLINENRIRLGQNENREEVIHILTGLACVAASSRSDSLARELKILIRVCRRDLEIDFSDLCRIGIIIAASNFDQKLWAESLGQWFTELSFDEISYEQAQIIENFVKGLCELAPELWVTLGRSSAALATVLHDKKAKT
jgi:hypothetical protein